MSWIKSGWKAALAFALGVATVLFLARKRGKKEISDDVASIKQALKNLDSGKVKPEVEKQVREELNKRLEAIREEIKNQTPDEHMADLERDLDRLLGKP